MQWHTDADIPASGWRNNYGIVSTTYTLGALVTGAPALAENFDARGRAGVTCRLDNRSNRRRAVVGNHHRV